MTAPASKQVNGPAIAQLLQEERARTHLRAVLDHRSRLADEDCTGGCGTEAPVPILTSGVGKRLVERNLPKKVRSTREIQGPEEACVLLGVHRQPLARPQPHRCVRGRHDAPGDNRARELRDVTNERVGPTCSRDTVVIEQKHALRGDDPGAGVARRCRTCALQTDDPGSELRGNSRDLLRRTATVIDDDDVEPHMPL